MTTRSASPDAAEESVPTGRDEVVAAILDSAAEMFAERGPAAASIRDIAARAHVNHGLVFRHFGTKEQLVAAVLDHLAANLTAMTNGEARRATSTPPPRAICGLSRGPCSTGIRRVNCSPAFPPQPGCSRASGPSTTTTTVPASARRMRCAAAGLAAVRAVRALGDRTARFASGPAAGIDLHRDGQACPATDARGAVVSRFASGGCSVVWVGVEAPRRR